MLAVRNVEVVYDDVILVLRGVSLEVPQGKIVALLGANGAGKTTLLRAVSGLLDVHDGEVTKGGVRLDGRPIHRLRPAAVVRRGVSQVMEGRRIFAELTVEENLLIGAHRGRPGGWSLARVYELFPVLRERRAMSGIALSGGQQQMLAIGRGLMANPRLLLLDEVSLGLAPAVVHDIYRALLAIVGEGTTTLFVEQDVGRALGVCDRLYCFQEGRISLEGRPRDLTRAQIAAAYFGV